MMDAAQKQVDGAMELIDETVISALDMTDTEYRKNGTPGALRVIILDDNRFDQMRIQRMAEKIGQPMDLTIVGSIDALETELDGGSFDVALVDYRLEGETGLDAIRLIRAHPLASDMASIMVASDAETEVVVNAIRSGCSDYLSKESLSAERLGSAIANALRDSLVDENLSAPEKLRYATYCVLQGISEACFGEMRPIIGKMFKQVSFIRGCHAHGYTPSPEALRDIEEGCLQIWQFLEELDVYADSWKGPTH